MASSCVLKLRFHALDNIFELNVMREIRHVLRYHAGRSHALAAFTAALPSACGELNKGRFSPALQTWITGLLEPRYVTPQRVRMHVPGGLTGKTLPSKPPSRKKFWVCMKSKNQKALFRVGAMVVKVVFVYCSCVSCRGLGKLFTVDGSVQFCAVSTRGGGPQGWDRLHWARIHANH